MAWWRGSQVGWRGANQVARVDGVVREARGGKFREVGGGRKKNLIEVDL